ncbi:CheR family methyltransferase [Porticoccus sp.]
MEQHEALTDSAFNRWAGLLEQRTGVRVTPAWEGHMRRTLNARLNGVGNDGARPGGEWPGDWQGLLDQLLIRETAFFRHRPSFDFLACYLAERAPSAAAAPLRFWSAGCASGEEAYSMVITAQQALPASRFEILATDISAAALRQARAATYSAAALSDLTAPERAGFQTLGDGRVQLQASLRRPVQFVLHNLVDRDWPAEARDMDVIFCQHLLIYFGHERRDALVARLASRLKPGGCLVLGPGEYLSRAVPGMQRDRCSEALVFVRGKDSGLEY